MSNHLTQTIKSFRGLRQFISKTRLDPEFAEDCLNVIVSRSGGLEKFRVPTPFTAPIANIGPLPIIPFFDYQQSGVRQIVGVMGADLVFWNTALAPTIIEIDAAWGNSIVDMIEANNELYLMNVSKAKKWLGNPQLLQKWGIAAPVAAPTVVILGGIIDTIANVGAQRIGGQVNIRTTTPHNFDNADVAAGRQITIAGVSVGANTFNGTFALAAVPAPNIISYLQAGANEVQGGGTLTMAGGFAIAISRSYGISFSNSIDGGESSLSAITSIGPVLVATGYKILPPASPDGQVDHYFVYTSQDGGGDQFGNSDMVTGVPIASNYIDTNDDNHLFNNIVPQFINSPPPFGHYLAKFQDRIFIFRLVGAESDIAYSGYEKIARGVPAQCFPPNNRLRLSIGADTIRGGGVIQAGVVAFSKSNEMYMFRGIVEDITTTDPVVFTAFLEQLPWSEGLLSHYTCAATPYGLAYVASDRTVKLFDGTNKPKDISGGLYPYLSRITDGAEESVRGTFFNWLEREWYALILPLDGSKSGTHIMFFDLDADDNFGSFPLQQPCDSIGVIEDVTGRRHLIFSNAGQMYELKVTSNTVGGVTPNPTAQVGAQAPILPAYWRGGYFGNDTPQMKRLWRTGRLITDQPGNAGFLVRSRLVDDDQYSFRQPRIKEHALYRGGKFQIDWHGTRLQLEIQFPQVDMDANVLELQMQSIVVGDKV